MRVTSVLLAAGKSERMGQNKLLLDLHGKKVIDHILDALQHSHVNEIVIVVGNKPEEIVDAVKSRENRARIVFNERFEEGMTSSFKAALKHIKNVDAALLVLGDQLILDSVFINAMINEMEANLGKALIVSPIHNGKKGHPLLFSKELFNEILALKDNEVVRDVIHRHYDALHCLPGDKWTIMDMDTPKDVEEVNRFLQEKS